MSFIKLLLPLAVFAFALSSCRKHKDTIAKVYVYNSDNEPVSGAVVKLMPNSDNPYNKAPVGEKSAVTNSSGEASFDFTEEFKPGQAGVAVLEIDVNSGSGSGIIKVVEETVSEEKVIL